MPATWDVVPPGDAAAWRVGPFRGEVRDGELHGRGAVDMKGAVAAWIAAVARTPAPRDGSLSLLITGDEEGEAVDGTRRVVETLIAQGERGWTTAWSASPPAPPCSAT